MFFFPFFYFYVCVNLLVPSTQKRRGDEETFIVVCLPICM